jgi:hypothetical protein
VATFIENGWDAGKDISAKDFEEMMLNIYAADEN